MVRRFVTMLVALSLLVTGLLAGSAQAVGGKVSVWAPKFQDGAAAVSDQQAIKDAQSFDVLSALKGPYRGKVPAMRAANPALKTLVYQNAVFAQEYEGPTSGVYAANLYLKDAQGRYITSKQHGNWLMNATHPEWVANRVKACADHRLESGMEGCLMDVLGTAAVSPGFTVCAGTTTPCAAVDPRDGRPFTAEEWLTATGNIAAKVRSTDPAGSQPRPAYVYGNGLTNGKKYFGTERTSRLMSSLDGGWAENFLRSGARTTPLTAWPTEADWKLDVNMVADVSKRGKPILTTTKLWIDTSTETLKHQWHRFALSSFMLGKTGQGYFNISYNDGQAARTFYNAPTAYWNKKLGAPKGAYSRLTSGAYQRLFATGKVLVNPTTKPKTVSLGGALCDFNNVRKTSVTLPAHDGQIFTPCA